MNDYRTTLAQQFTESHRLEDEIMKQLDRIGFNANIERNNKMSNISKTATHCCLRAMLYGVRI